MKTVFFDCHQPLLHSAAGYLVRQFYDADRQRLDMRRAVLALPGRRAINRLEEILAETAEKLDPAWYPPEFLTVGDLPEKFYKQRYALADELTQCFAWLNAADQFDEEYPDMFRGLIPNPPKKEDLNARLALGQMFAGFHRELAGDMLDFSSAAEICRSIPGLDSEVVRWETLARLEQKYLAKLDSLHLWDKQAARLFAIERQNSEEYRQILDQYEQSGTQFLLIGLVDLNKEQKSILRKFAKLVTILIFAPENTKDRFDEFGCLIPEKWQNASLRLQDEQICMAGSVDEQAKTVLRCLASMNNSRESKLAPSEMTVGVPDKQVVPALTQQFDLTECKARLVEGTSVRQTSVYRFLETLQKYLDNPSFAAAAGLLRHPDLETRLSKELSLPNPDGGMAENLDRCSMRFMPN
ncbi:MAG: hypothetical protein LBH00_09620 [Planctomycetaceae bacterium]|jgi:hypothetical protein|nr:hypothetical protein [Planctomycetaceae bacterium]